MKPKKDAQGKRRGKGVKQMAPWSYDPYHTAEQKPEQNTACPQCGAAFLEGRWTWSRPTKQSVEKLCPACLRIRDHVPAGILSLQGRFLKAHTDEILNLVSHVEERERNEHPMKRIMQITPYGDSIVIETTEIHLARGLGTAVQAAYQGSLDYSYPEEAGVFRAKWCRD